MGADKEPPQAGHLNLTGLGTKEVSPSWTSRRLLSLSWRTPSAKTLTGKLAEAITGKLAKAITGKLAKTLSRKLIILAALNGGLKDPEGIKAALKAGLKDYDNDDVKDTLTDDGKL